MLNHIMLAAAEAPSGAANLTTAITNALSSVYTDISGIFTALCAVGIAITLVLMMVSKNQRAVESAREWRNRIIGTWVIFNALGTIVKYGRNLLSNSGFNQWDGTV